VTVLAAIRPDDWGLPLLLHVLGASMLVGGLAAAVLAQFLGWKRQEHGGAAIFSRLSFRALLLAALPGWIVMRIGAEWIYRKEGWDEVEEAPTWLDVGFITTDMGAIVFLLALVLTGFAARRASTLLGRVATVLTTILLVAYGIAVWAMTGKPT
jgi:hypothetical protein